MVNYLGLLGSYTVVVPLVFFLCWAASAEVMLGEVDRTYSRVAERERLEERRPDSILTR